MSMKIGSGVCFVAVVVIFVSVMTPIINSATFSSLTIHTSGAILLPGAIIDGYAEANYNDLFVIGTLHPSDTWGSDSAESQSFIGTESRIIAAGFYLRKSGNPTGEMYAVLYSHNGTFGVNSTPNSELARSDPIE